MTSSNLSNSIQFYMNEKKFKSIDDAHSAIFPTIQKTDDNANGLPKSFDHLNAQNPLVNFF